MITDVYLIHKTKTREKDEFGDPVYEETVKRILAEKRTVGMNEFYQAMSAGFRPEIAINIFDFRDYSNQEEFICDGMRYKVLRAYQNGDHIELTGYGGVHERTKVCREI